MVSPAWVVPARCQRYQRARPAAPGGHRAAGGYLGRPTRPGSAPGRPARRPPAGGSTARWRCRRRGWGRRAGGPAGRAARRTSSAAHPSGASTVTAAWSSPRVGALVDDRHRHAALGGAQHEPAARTSPPATSRARAAAAPARPGRSTRATRAGGTVSPKNTTSGLTRPPQQSAQSTARTASSSASAQLHVAVRVDRGDRGREFRVGRAQPPVQSARGPAPQSRQTTRSRLPCSSTTRRAPPAWCRPSTFCVMIPPSRPRCCSRATARWPALGARPAMVPPAQVAARPVPPAGHRVAGEGLVGHRRVPARPPRSAPGSPGCRTRWTARAAEYDDVPGRPPARSARRTRHLPNPSPVHAASTGHPPTPNTRRSLHRHDVGDDAGDVVRVPRQRGPASTSVADRPGSVAAAGPPAAPPGRPPRAGRPSKSSRVADARAQRQVGLDLRCRPRGPARAGPAGGVRRPRSRVQLALVHRALHVGVVLGEPEQLAAAQPVRPGVADVHQRQLGTAGSSAVSVVIGGPRPLAGRAYRRSTPVDRLRQQGEQLGRGHVGQLQRPQRVEGGGARRRHRRARPPRRPRRAAAGRRTRRPRCSPARHRFRRRRPWSGKWDRVRTSWPSPDRWSTRREASRAAGRRVGGDPPPVRGDRPGRRGG